MTTQQRTIEPTIEEKFRAKQEAWERHQGHLRTNHRVYLGDARKMAELGSSPCVHLVVTSPPYWTLKKYPGEAGEDQLGHIDDYNQFHENLDKVWKRCFDLIIPGGRLCIVVGDVCISRRKAGRHFVVPLHADISTHCRSIGFDYLTPILWHKIANATTEVEGNGSTFLGKPYEPNAIIKNDVEYILMFRKPGGYRHPSQEQRDLSIIEPDDHDRWFRQIWSDIPGEMQTKHPAPFPKVLAFRLISMFSFVGDTVLDPFGGIGSTLAAAIESYRSSVSYEIERSYFDLMIKRFRQGLLGVDIKFFD